MANSYDFMKNFDNNNTRFKAEISKYIDENKRKEGHIVLGETPPVLGLAGANTKLPLVIPCEQINHIIDKHYRESNNYGLLEKEDTLKLYESIINPICLISGSEKDTCVVITDFKNKDGINIQVPIFFNMSEEFITVNDIASQYPNKQMEEYIIKEVFKHNLLAYHNKKLENSLRTIGLLLPVVNTNISSNNNISHMIKNVNSYDDSIVHNLNNVKYANKYSIENVYYEFETNNKYFKPIFKASFTEIYNACKELNLDTSEIYSFKEVLINDNPVLKFKRESYDSKYDNYYSDLLVKIHNKLIENKSKEIDEKLKEIKAIINDNSSEINITYKEMQIFYKNYHNKDKFYGPEERELRDSLYKIYNQFIDDYIDKKDFSTLNLNNNDIKILKSFLEEKTMLNVREVIENNIKSYLQSNSYKDAVTLDQKIVNQYEYLEKLFKNFIKEDKGEGVGYNAACFSSLGLIDDSTTIENKLYPDYIGDKIEKYCKDCSVVFDDMYKKSKENLTKIKTNIKEQLVDTIFEFKGETFDEKMINFYNYYKDVFKKNLSYSEDKGVGYNFAKDGNGSCCIYYDDIREFYKYDKDNIVPEEDQRLYDIYLRDVNSVCKEMFDEAFNRVKENNIYGKAIKEVEEKKEVDTLLEDSKNIISERIDSKKASETKAKPKKNTNNKTNECRE